MSIRPSHHNFAGRTQNTSAARMQKMRERFNRWEHKANERKAMFLERQKARVERYRNAFAGSWISKIGLGLIAIWNFITNPPFFVKIEKRPAVAFTAMLPWGISFSRADTKNTRRQSTTRNRLTPETLEQRQLLAADITGVDDYLGTEVASFTDNPANAVDTASTNDATPTISGTLDGTDPAHLHFQDSSSATVAGDITVSEVAGGPNTWTFTPTSALADGETISVVESATAPSTFMAEDSVTISFEASIDVAANESIQAAIDAAPAGTTINLAATTYTEAISITKPMKLVGHSSGTTIDADGSAYAIHVTDGADDVTIENLTVTGASYYGIHTNGPTGIENLTITDVTATSNGRTGIDLNRVETGSVTGSSATNNGGFGLSISSGSNITITDLVESDNIWGGVGIFPSAPASGVNNSEAFPTGIAFDGASTSVPGGFHVQPKQHVGTFSVSTDGGAADIKLPASHAAMVYSFRTDTNNNNTLANFEYVSGNPSDVVLAKDDPTDRFTFADIYIKNTSTGDFTVSPSLSIQTAIDEADAGATIHIEPADYSESLSVTKPIVLQGDPIGGIHLMPGAAGDNVITIPSNYAGTGQVKLQNIEVKDATAGGSGLVVAAGAHVDSLVIDGSKFNDNAFQGVAIYGTASAPSTVSVTISDSYFNRNGGPTSSSGDGDLVFFQHTGDVTLSNIFITGKTSSPAENAIQFRSDNGSMGTVSINDVSIDGSYEKVPLAIYSFSSISRLTGSSNANNAISATSTGWMKAVNIESGGDIDFTALGFDVMSNQPVELQGDSGTNAITGGTEDNLIRGGEGNDTLVGDLGDDVAIYTGSRTDYTLGLTANSSGFVTGFTSVKDINATDGDEGTDALSGIEVLYFASNSGVTTDDIALNLADQVQLFDANDKLVATFGGMDLDAAKSAVLASDSEGLFARFNDGTSFVIKSIVEDNGSNIFVDADASDVLESQLDQAAGSGGTGQVEIDLPESSDGSNPLQTFAANLANTSSAGDGAVNVTVNVPASLNAADLTLDVPDDVVLTINLEGQTIGGEALETNEANQPSIKVTGGNVKLTGSATISSAGTAPAISVTGGTLSVNGALSLNGGSIEVANGGTLGGSGTINGNVVVATGATHAPGNSIAIQSSGNYTLSSDLDIEIQGPYATAGTDYDQVNVTGTVVLNSGATLNLIDYMSGAALDDDDEVMVIINNDLADAVSGTFDSLPEGATVGVGGFTGRISYVGGDGNDVVLYGDTVNPTISTLILSDTEITEADDAMTVTLTITFDESMDNLSTPLVTSNATTTLTNSTGAWLGAGPYTKYQVTYTVADAEVDLDNVMFDVSGAKDVAGNTMTAVTGQSTDTVSSIDTIAPNATPTGKTIDENPAAGLVLETLPATETGGDALAYSLSQTTGSTVPFTAFALTGTDSNVLEVANASFFDFEASELPKVDITVTDPAGNSTTTTYTVTLSNINDAPEDSTAGTSVTAQTIAERADTNDAAENATPFGTSGNIFFHDDDLSDSHSVTSTPGSISKPSHLAAGALGIFGAGSPNAETGDGEWSVLWTFTIGSPLPPATQAAQMAQIDSLADGEQIVQNYTVTITDDAGTPSNPSDDLSLVTNVVVTITGTNDDPTITVETGDSAAAPLTESDLGQTASGTLSVEDLDVTDEVITAVDSVAVTGTGSGSVPTALDNATLKGYMSVDMGNVIDNSNTEGAINWDFDSNGEAFDFLADGETLILTYQISASDGFTGGTDATQDVVVTITGSNDDPILGFVQGFETDTADVFTLSDYGAITGPVASGTNGIPAASGSSYAVVTEADADPDTGPFTRFGGYTNEFIDGQVASVDVYLDTSWIADQSFQYSVAANNQVGTHLHDFGFQVRSDGNGNIEVGASNGATQVPLTSTPANAVTVSTSGWYTLKHVFNDESGVLSVDMILINKASGESLDVATLSNPTEMIATDVGGIRYGWFTDISLDNGLAIDNLTLGAFDGEVTEVADGVANEETTTYTASGGIKFSDTDLTDVHSITATPGATGYIGIFTPLITNAATGSGQGAVGWTFTANNSEFDYLADGEQLVQTYVVTVDDNEGATASQTVTVTITGSDDDPTISLVGSDSAAEGLIETNDELAVTGTLSVED
ncbi:VCBS repeat-containing protein, partial [Neorhodopirellula lusitana]